MDAFIAVTSDQESNVLSCLLARSLGVQETVVRIDKMAYVPLMESIGIRHCVSPRMAAVSSILQYIRAGTVLSSLSVGWDAAEMQEVLIPENAPVTGKALKDIRVPTGALLIALLRDGNAIIPTGDTRMEAGDRAVWLCLRPVVPALERSLTAQGK